MNRTISNIIIDIIAAFLFLGMIATGYLLRFPLPPGSNKMLSLWGYTRHQWGRCAFLDQSGAFGGACCSLGTALELDSHRYR